MKKIFARLLLVLLVLIIAAAVWAHLALDGTIKKGVETFGPKLTKTEVTLQGVNLSLLSGSGKITGLNIGNTKEFKSPSAIRVGTAALELTPMSLLSDKVVIQSFSLEAPEVTFETDMRKNNLSTLLANVEEATGGSDKSSAPASDGKPAKKLQVDDVRVTGGKIHVTLTALGGKSATVSLPEIHLTGLGQGPDGITPAELTKRILTAIEQETVKAASQVIADLGKGAVYMSKEAGGAATNAVDKVSKGIGDLFKKK